MENVRRWSNNNNVSDAKKAAYSTVYQCSAREALRASSYITEEAANYMDQWITDHNKNDQCTHLVLINLSTSSSTNAGSIGCGLCRCAFVFGGGLPEAESFKRIYWLEHAYTDEGNNRDSMVDRLAIKPELLDHLPDT